MSIRSYFKVKDSKTSEESEASKSRKRDPPPAISEKTAKKARVTKSAEKELENDISDAGADADENGSEAAKVVVKGSTNKSSTEGKDCSKGDEHREVEELPSEVIEKIEKNKQAALARKRASTGGKPDTVMEAALLLPDCWKEVLSAEFSKDYFKSLSNFVSAERSGTKPVYPPIDEVFTAFHLCPFDKVSVVIVGQDPYHGPGQAHGLAFSVQRPVPPPPSLLNMYKELESDPATPFKRPPHGCLEAWARQGVFMLNAALTVRQAEPNSHQKRGWERFTDATIAALNSRRDGLVFLLWGKPAADKCKAVDPKRHKVLKAPHPSPLSASRGFFGCRHFSMANQHLKTLGRPPIDWQL